MQSDKNDEFDFKLKEKSASALEYTSLCIVSSDDPDESKIYWGGLQVPYDTPVFLCAHEGCQSRYKAISVMAQDYFLEEYYSHDMSDSGLIFPLQSANSFEEVYSREKCEALPRIRFAAGLNERRRKNR